MDELLTVLEGRKDLTLEDTSRLKYMEMCIKESMRLFPLGPFLPRDVLQTFRLGMLQHILNYVKLVRKLLRKIYNPWRVLNDPRSVQRASKSEILGKTKRVLPRTFPRRSNVEETPLRLFALQ